jgi:hypothetical protein
MTDKQTGGPAFPLMYDVPSENLRHIHVGMTLRDYFAGLAMQGMYAGFGGNPPEPEQVVKDAYYIADAMLKAREA